jgi:succinyl-CoA synthetase beta subunit
VCRLSGTNSEKGKEILNNYSAKNSSFKILTADNLDDAAQKAVSTLKK